MNKICNNNTIQSLKYKLIGIKLQKTKRNVKK